MSQNAQRVSLDPLADDLRLLNDLLVSLPHRPSPPVVWRWMKKGVRGTRLQTLKIAGRLHTTETEFRRFVLAIQAPNAAEITDEQHKVIDQRLSDAGYVE